MFFTGEDGRGARGHVIDHARVFGGDADEHRAVGRGRSGIGRVGG
jgi:hypothetical protein